MNFFNTITILLGCLISSLIFLINIHLSLIFSLVGFVSYFILIYSLTRYSQKSLSPWKFGMIIAICMLIIQFVGMFLTWGNYLYSVVNVLFYSMGIFMGYLFCRSKIRGKILAITISLICCFYYSELTLIYHEPSVKKYLDTKVLMTDKQYDFKLFYPDGKSVMLPELTGIKKVLFFWITNDYSKKELKNFTRLAQKYDNLNDVLFYTVHCYDLENKLHNGTETFETGSTLVNKEDGIEGILSIPLQNDYIKMLDLLKMPQVLIFDPQGKIIFRGDVNDASTYIE